MTRQTLRILFRSRWATTATMRRYRVIQSRGRWLAGRVG